jgi:excisionase family DNA binding protein
MTKTDPVIAPKPVQAPIEPQTLRIPEAAIYVGCTNFFMEELLRSDQIKWVQMGDHKAVYREDLDDWLVRFKQSKLYERAVERWKVEHPGEVLPQTIFTDEMAQELFRSVERGGDGTLLSNDEDDS